MDTHDGAVVAVARQHGGDGAVSARLDFRLQPDAFSGDSRVCDAKTHAALTRKKERKKERKEERKKETTERKRGSALLTKG